MLLTSPIQQFQFYDKYARFNPDEGRRETWSETVTRAVDYLRELSEDKLPDGIYDRMWQMVYDGKVMPSMRLMAMAGDAARRENNVIYNCAYLPIDSISSWVEMLTICMGGSGVGYSVEKQYVNKLPTIERQKEGEVVTHVISDSSLGWATALGAGLKTWFAGYDIEFDYSLIRPQGAVLKTKGGRASGPEPLRKLLTFARKVILSRQGDSLSTLDCHDLCTMLADCVVQGGVRRSAMIALFDADDTDMLTCKDPGNIEGNYHRFNANNSVVWTRNMSREDISAQMHAMHNGGNGEPGIFSRLAANLLAPERRESWMFGTNPCGEIILRPRQFCNLSSAVARVDDTILSLIEKVEMASIIGTIQSSATHFPHLPVEWQKNCEEERLLGVDITGQMDCPLMYGEGSEWMMSKLRERAVETNKWVADALGINRSVAVTCVKPSGNSSVMLDCSPGIHPRHSANYIRRVRVNTSTPMYWLLFMEGAKMTQDIGQPSMYVAEFYVKSPEGAIVKGDRGAIQQLDYWLKLKENYTEHNPSATITYRPEELEDVIDWLFKNQHKANGLSFLPASDHMYELAPYEAVDSDTMNSLLAQAPTIDFEKIHELDGGMDNTVAAQELACVAGGCDI